MIRTANLTGPVSRSAGGLYESVRRLAQELYHAGLDLSVLGSFDQFTQSDITAWDPVTVRAFRPIGPIQFAYSPGYLEFLKLFRPEILHSHGIWIYTSIVTHRYAMSSHIPYMVSPHGMLDPWAVRNSSWKKIPAYWLYERAHLHGATVMRALCESEAESFRKFGLTNPIVIIPNGIDLGEEEEFSMLEAKGEPSGRKTLLFLGRIHPKKGLPNLIRAFSKKLKDIKQGGNQEFPWHLVIAGWDQGGHEADLMRLCEELGLSFSRRKNKESKEEIGNDVIFHGAVFGPEKSKLLHNADAFILPSFSEGLPMSILEAWSYALPVVMTPECNLPEGYAAGAAIRIEIDVETIATGLDTLFSMHDSELKMMGAKGRGLVRQKFTWHTVAGQMKDTYAWMLGGGTPPANVRID